MNKVCFVLGHLSSVFDQAERRAKAGSLAGANTQSRSSDSSRRFSFLACIADLTVRPWTKFKRWLDLPKDPMYKGYSKVVEDRANQIANNIWVFILVSLLFAVFNGRDVIAIWTSSTPSLALAGWTVGHARIYFEFLYFLLHGVITSFFLGSGVVGLVGTLLILQDIFRRPLRLDYYRRTEIVIEFVTWLIMWTLVGLSSVLVFGRPILFQRVNIPALFNSGIVQSILGSSLVIALGFLPFLLVIHAISKAKNSELLRLEDVSCQVRELLVKKLCSRSKYRASSQEGAVDQDSCQLKELQEEYEAITNMIKQIKEIPNLPIEWGSILRVVVGAIISLGSSVTKDWMIARIGIK